MPSVFCVYHIRRRTNLSLVTDMLSEKWDTWVTYGPLILKQSSGLLGEGSREERSWATWQLWKGWLPYTDQLMTEGFWRVTRDDLPCDSCCPGKYYIILTKEHYWDIDKIIVVDNFQFHQYQYLMNLVIELVMSKLTHWPLVEDWSVTQEWENKRGNFQLNHGSNHLDVTNDTKICGMHVAWCHVWPTNIEPGLAGNRAMHDLLICMQVIMTKILDYILGYSWGRKGSTQV